ncbi:MAG: D-alanine--D-alanine ligase [Treponema sp.]|nr:D-alanine--D-alanine ligase [Treponema sp.]
MTVALIYGGKSGEHEVSLMSASAVARNIKKDVNVVLIAITKDGKWFYQDENELLRVRGDAKSTFKIIENASNEIKITLGRGNHSFETAEKQFCVDVVFPVLHGPYGEDGTIQGLFEMMDIPYIGCTVEASALTMDKEKTKVVLSQSGIPVVPYVALTRADLLDSKSYDERVQKAISSLGFPLFVKPCSAGSSDGATKVKDERHLSFAIMEAFEWDDKILIEKAIDAREIECAVTGNTLSVDGKNDFEKVCVYGPGEIMLTHEFYDYNAKYNDSDGTKIPADVSNEMRVKIREFAKKAYKEIEASGLCRIDFFVDKKNDSIYLNEINSMPGFTAISMFPKLCESEGLHFSDLIDFLIEEAFARFKNHSVLRTSR